MLSILGKQLTFNGEHELVGRIHNLYETTAVAALGYLLSIPQHTACNTRVSVNRCHTKCCLHHHVAVYYHSRNSACIVHHHLGLWESKAYQ